jgi:CO/xanthine dehydrogenase FAD-binding subunit
LGGGVFLAQANKDDFAVVDLRNLGLDEIHHRGVYLEAGATVTLAQLARDKRVSPKMRAVVNLEAAEEIRNKGTIGGTLVVADGGSPLTTLLLAMDAQLSLSSGKAETSLGDFLPFRKDLLSGHLITRITFPVNVALAFNSITHGNDPRPLVEVGVARWPSGRTRVALGGYGAAPVLAFDSPEDSGVAFAVEDALSRAGDAHATAQDRQAAAVKLTHEGLATLKPAGINPSVEG